MNKDVAPQPSLSVTSITGDAVLKLPEVTKQTSKCRSSIYQSVKNGTFPPPIKLGERSVGWLASEITAWIESRKTARREEAA